jgi:mono/diheme cytochrome c family protein
MRHRLLQGLIAAMAAFAPSCGNSPLSPSAQRGHKVFMETSSPTCASCHTFGHAGTKTVVGPNLDQMRPSRDKIRSSVTQGVGVMPTQKGILTPAQIEDVASYLLEAAGRSKGE